MSDVRIAELKSRLSEYLRKVRRGHSVTVLDRETPIARLVPYEGEAMSLTIKEPLKGAPRLREVPLPAPLRIEGDVVTLLHAERQSDR